MNLWHDIPSGTEEMMNVIVEIPRGSKNKYEIDKETGLIALDRVLHTAQTYPFEYCFIPQTYWDDGDALDVILLATEPIPSGMLVRVRPIALMEFVDSGEQDNKIIAVPITDPRFDAMHDLTDINPHTLKEIEHFFCTYKQLQNKVCTVQGFKPRAEALVAFRRSKHLYQEKFAT